MSGSQKPASYQQRWTARRDRVAAALGVDTTHAQIRYSAVLDALARPGVRWLELGCGHRIVPDYFTPLAEQRVWVERVRSIVGIDVDEGLLRNPLIRLRVKGLGGSLPFAPGTFDLVSANMVAEHLPDPRAVLEDVRRVLRPGGKFVFLTPNYLYYLIAIASLTPEWLKKWLILQLERREACDVFPAFYRMNTPARIRALARASGFHVSALRVVGSGGTFQRLGPIGVAELFVLKGLEAFFDGRLQSNLIAVLERVD
jgi:SAM-dependent methyltransferase